jgi:hypothetical protein
MAGRLKSECSWQCLLGIDRYAGLMSATDEPDENDDYISADEIKSYGPLIGCAVIVSLVVALALQGIADAFYVGDFFSVPSAWAYISIPIFVLAFLTRSKAGLRLPNGRVLSQAQLRWSIKALLLLNAASVVLFLLPTMAKPYWWPW